MEELGETCVLSFIDDPACEGNVEFAPDPYQSEINDDHTPVWMCENHRYEISQDI
jgi:hypothetical protein